MNFLEKLSKVWKENDTLLCVGLDPDISRIPQHLREFEYPIFEFCKEIVDSTHDLVCAFKPQIAYFSAESAENQLEMLTTYIKNNYPHIPIILDSKRGDIGATADKYAIEAFKRYQVDAVTVNPYMGYDTAEPFLKYSDKGTILLCRTSNLGAGDIQDLLVGEKTLYHHIAELAATKWNKNNNCLLVVGATWPNQMKEVRDIVGDMPFLVPGVGAQGGDVEALIKAGQTENGTGLIISSSRAVIYASNGIDFADSARNVAKNLRDSINQYRTYV
ncbi:orotidine-5'-phosphate decarboxylase [Zobellella sp. DQSA1]|uniref:orotidine-5'-phosphate decarboxylase n=1 Tax=Zobellella sp. DQSA1 TaxID=3342386 RepID=UPI0035C24EAE